ncbi:hypothetical protein LSH36_432g01003 [Paralvinella palmiformis]|uniref:Uncharacterized protein n=1 Tax=Paralvinella palmiformis TaxID=53620 RepID=A0AAD9MZI1_9ANNE|nr:hypothetical protein LSH36_432g01003 [Paralvinella palmiformis]
MADQCTDSEDQTLFSRGSTPLYSVDSTSDHVTNDLPRRVVTRDAAQTDQSQSTTEDDRSQDNVSADIQTSSRISSDHPYAIPPFDDLLGSVHEKAVDETGFGKLQWVLLFIMGAGLMGDSIELLMVVYMLPGAAMDLCMDDTMKAWLGK